MELIIEFFRDTLSGPLYIVTVVVAVILFFACIGYLAEKSINAKKEKEKYATVDNSVNTPVTINEPVVDNPISVTQDVDNVTNVIQPNVTPIVSENNIQVENNSIPEVSAVTDEKNTIHQESVPEVSIPEVATIPQQFTSIDAQNVVNNTVNQTLNSVPEVNDSVVIPTINQDNNTI